MSAPDELEVWGREWREVAAVPPDLRARVDRGSRRLRVMRIVDVAVTVTMGGWTTGWALIERSPDVIGLAVMTWAFLALAWTFALINRAGTWSPEAVTVSAFLDLSILRVRRGLIAAAFGSVLYIVQLAFCLGWIYVRVAPHRGVGLGAFLTSWPVLIVWACTVVFYVGLGGTCGDDEPSSTRSCRPPVSWGPSRSRGRSAIPPRCTSEDAAARGGRGPLGYDPFMSIGSPVVRLLARGARPTAGVALLLLLVVAVAATARAQNAAAPGPAAANWTQFRGNPALTGRATSDAAATLKVLWTFETGAEPVESSAAIVDGVAYVGSQSGELLALGLNDGKPRWRYKTTQGVGESSPAVAQGLVFVGDLGGVFHAVRVADGKAAWTFKTEGEIKSSPVVVGDRVLIGSYDGNLYGLDLKTGKQAWSVHTENYVHGTPAVSDGVAYLAGCDEVFRAIRITDGKELFTLKIGAYTGASVALEGQKAYFGTFNNEVLGVDIAAKKVMWRYQHPERQFPFYSSAALAAGRVVLGGRDKMIHAIDAASGKAAWTFTTRARVESSPAIASGRVYVGSNDGRFYVLDLASGKKLWEYESGSPLSASPAVAGGRVVIGTNDGAIICFG